MKAPRAKSDIGRCILAALSFLVCSGVSSGQSPENIGGENRPWIALNVAYSRFADRSLMNFSAGLAHPSWSSRNIALLQGTIGLPLDSGTSSRRPWRFILLDFDRELDLDEPFDWSPCYKSNGLKPPVPFSWHIGATLLDLDHTTAAENESRWIQMRAGLVQRYIGGTAISLRAHAAAGAATVRLGEAEYSSLGSIANETMTGGDLRVAGAADIQLSAGWNGFITGSIDAEARMLPLGLNSRRGTVGAQLQMIGRFGCSGMGGGIYVRGERQWTEIEQNRHSLNRLLVGMHVGLIDSDEEKPLRP